MRQLSGVSNWRYLFITKKIWPGFAHKQINCGLLCLPPGAATQTQDAYYYYCVITSNHKENRYLDYLWKPGLIGKVWVAISLYFFFPKNCMRITVIQNMPPLGPLEVSGWCQDGNTSTYFMITEVKHLDFNQFSDGSNLLGSGECCCRAIKE